MKVVNEKLLNRKLFRKLKVDTYVDGNTANAGYVACFRIDFPTRGPASKLTRKQVEPLRKQIERTLHGWGRVLQ